MSREAVEAYAVVTKDGSFDLFWSLKMANEAVDTSKGEEVVTLLETGTKECG